MKNLQNKLFLSCLKVTELLEKREIIPLNLLEKIRLRVHLSMCKACHAYEKQSETIDALFEKLGNSLDEDEIASSQKRLTEKLNKSK
jgi:hypothetical protein